MSIDAPPPPTINLAEAVRHLEETLGDCHKTLWKLQSDHSTLKQSAAQATTLREECEILEHALAKIRGQLMIAENGGGLNG